MATYDLTRSELNSLLAADHVDPTVRQSVLQYLSENGDLSGPGSKVEVQESGYPPTLDPERGGPDRRFESGYGSHGHEPQGDH